MKRVLVSFSDNTLGGTSRSALLTGMAWRHAGYIVDFSAEVGIHPERRREFTAIGQLVGGMADTATRIESYDAIHLHHGAWSAQQVGVANELISRAHSGSRIPLLLTHNVFAVPDALLDGWPGVRVVGVLSSWGKYQYIYARRIGGRKPPLVVVHNPQDTAFFRPPTEAEREEARMKRGFTARDRVILRVGSPHASKWSAAYSKLLPLDELSQLVLIGAPTDMARELAAHPNVRVYPTISSSEELRGWYWASDLFAHAAQRGESFGNVLLEAALCGLGVTYLSRPYRDNAPWEFDRVLTRFTYHRSQRSWLRAVATDSFDPPTSCLALSEAQDVSARYSVEKLAQVLDLATSSAEGVASTARPKFFDRMKIRVRHNPLVTIVKEWRLRSS